MNIEKHVNQAFLTIRLETKDKLAANQVDQNRIKVSSSFPSFPLACYFKDFRHLDFSIKHANFA